MLPANTLVAQYTNDLVVTYLLFLAPAAGPPDKDTVRLEGRQNSQNQSSCSDTWRRSNLCHSSGRYPYGHWHHPVGIEKQTKKVHVFIHALTSYYSLCCVITESVDSVCRDGIIIQVASARFARFSYCGCGFARFTSYGNQEYDWSG